jgi:hypothetical protein
MLGDDMLYWRISEGGAAAPCNSTMPAWKDSLEEQARWDLVNCVRALGRGSRPEARPLTRQPNRPCGPRCWP